MKAIYAQGALYLIESGGWPSQQCLKLVLRRWRQGNLSFVDASSCGRPWRGDRRVQSSMESNGRFYRCVLFIHCRPRVHPHLKQHPNADELTQPPPPRLMARRKRRRPNHPQRGAAGERGGLRSREKRMQTKQLKIRMSWVLMKTTHWRPPRPSHLCRVKTRPSQPPRRRTTQLATMTLTWSSSIIIQQYNRQSRRSESSSQPPAERVLPPNARHLVPSTCWNKSFAQEERVLRLERMWVISLPMCSSCFFNRPQLRTELIRWLSKFERRSIPNQLTAVATYEAHLTR